MTLPKIKQVRTWSTDDATTGGGAGGGGYHDQGASHWIDDHIVIPMNKCHDYEQPCQPFNIGILNVLIIKVEAKNGQTGLVVSTVDEMGCFIIEEYLNRFIEDRYVSDIRPIYNQMFNATLYYSDSDGLVINTASCADLVLWGLFSKVVGLSIHRLLGGTVRGGIQLYAIDARSNLTKEMGFIGNKIPAHWGPHGGDARIRRDATMVAGMREKCGEDFRLVLDCWVSQNMNCAIKLARVCVLYNLKWIEKYPSPRQYEGYRGLKHNASAGVVVISGGHHGILQSFRTLLETDIDIIQPDVGWCDGLTTPTKIVAIAKSGGQLAVPHGSSICSHRAMITPTNTPFSEFLTISPGCSTTRPQSDPVLLNGPVPANGHIHRSVLDKPSFGAELNRNCNLKRPYSH